MVLKVQMLSFACQVLFVAAAWAASSSSAQEVSVIEFDNFGYSGTYNMVSELKNVDSDSCTCELSTEVTKFLGANAPIDEEVSVHFRGPLTLSKFGYYVADGDNWDRKAYYNGSLSSNVTFLTTAGLNSSCLGKALTYADSDGVSKASSATLLGKDTLINSQDEYSIFSTVKCGDSGVGKDCGVYRSGIPAFHGFYGSTKMFLFEFTMPTESKVLKSEVSNYNMPAIWLLNAHIPRTSQYSTNANCSCWRSGCGEFDIFEVKNNTDSTVNKLFSTIHDYQGTDDIESGIQANGYIPRDTEGTMVGGVVFDSDGKATVFVSNSTTFDSSISNSDVSDWVLKAGTAATEQLSSVSYTPATLTLASKSKGSGSSHGFSIMNAVFALALWMI